MCVITKSSNVRWFLGRARSLARRSFLYVEPRPASTKICFGAVLLPYRIQRQSPSRAASISSSNTSDLPQPDYREWRLRMNAPRDIAHSVAHFFCLRIGVGNLVEAIEQPANT